MIRAIFKGFYWIVETPFLLIYLLVETVLDIVVPDDEPLDFSLLEDIELDGVDFNDYPDFVDAYVAYATYKGDELTDEQYNEVNDNSDFVYDEVQKYIY